MSVAKFKVGDIVVSDRNPTCVQRVVKVEPRVISGKVCPGYDPMLSCVTIWRLDGASISSRPNKPSAAWAYRHVTSQELQAALQRLADLIATMGE